MHAAVEQIMISVPLCCQVAENKKHHTKIISSILMKAKFLCLLRLSYFLLSQGQKRKIISKQPIHVTSTALFLLLKSTRLTNGRHIILQRLSCLQTVVFQHLNQKQTNNKIIAQVSTHDRDVKEGAGRYILYSAPEVP